MFRENLGLPRTFSWHFGPESSPPYGHWKMAQKETDAAFLFTVGSFLLTVELCCLQLTILVFFLTVGALLLTVLASLLTIGALCLQWESASNKGVKGL